MQITFFVIPQIRLESIPHPVKSEDDMFDDSIYWDVDRFRLSLSDHIENFLPKIRSWSDDIIWYGKENSNRFSVLIEKDIVQSVSFRIDFTSNYEDVLRAIVEFCIFNNLAILTGDLNILPMNFETVKSHIGNSPQVVKYNNLSGQ